MSDLVLMRLTLFGFALLIAFGEGLREFWHGQKSGAVFWGLLSAVAIAAIWGTL